MDVAYEWLNNCICIHVSMYVYMYSMITLYILHCIFPFSEYFVKLWYLNQRTIDGFDLTNTTSLLMPMQIPNCSEPCPLETFTK